MTNVAAWVARLGYTGLSPTLVRFLLGVSLAGPLLAVGIAVAGVTRLDTSALRWAAPLLLLATLAERYSLHLTHKTTMSVATAAYIPMLLLLPTPLPGLLAVFASVVAQRLRGAELIEAAFNVGQTALYVTAGALTFGLLDQTNLGPDVGTFGSVGAIAVAATVLHVANSGLVALAGALQLGVNPLRAWWTNLSLDAMPHLVLSGLGVTATLIVVREPLALPFLIGSVLLIHHSVRQTVQLRVDTYEALAALVEVIELRDPYTAGHSRRVAMVARILALRLGLTAEEADLIELAGRVHDIGKAAIDPMILSKPGKLTADEWNEIKQHPVQGANVVRHFRAYHAAVPLIRHHHEAWDGSGYLDGLVGAEIPFGACILAVADTYDALTSDRPYRSGMPLARTLEILEEGSGTQWHSQVVAKLCAYARETNRILPAPAANVAPAPTPLAAGVTPATH